MRTDKPFGWKRDSFSHKIIWDLRFLTSGTVYSI